MRRGHSREEQYLTEPYEDKLATFVESNPELDLTYEETTEAFLDHCETFEELFPDDRSLAVVQEQAFTQMKWKLKDGK